MEMAMDRVHLDGRGSREGRERRCCPSGQERRGEKHGAAGNVEAYGKSRRALMLKHLHLHLYNYTLNQL